VEVLPGAVFLLGAGASKDAGIATSFELTRQISDRFNQPEAPSELAAVLNFVCAELMADDAAREGRSPFDSLDVERVFAAIRLLAERQSLEVSPFVASWNPAVDALDAPSQIPPFLDRDIRESILGTGIMLQPPAGSAARAIAQVIEAHENRPRGARYQELADRMLTELRSLISTTQKEVGYLFPLVGWGAGEQRVVIATLNYDRSIELAAEARRILCDTGLETWLRQGRWDPPRRGVYLLKLHGSIDWVWTEHERPGTLPYQSVRVTEGRDQGEPALVFGAGAKLQAKGPFLSLLAEFERELERASQLVCIGYSFRDDHVNELIRRWSARPVARRLTVVDPGWRSGLETRNPFRELLVHSLGQANRSEPDAILLDVVEQTAAEALMSIET
jgi:SIR2-like protein